MDNDDASKKVDIQLRIQKQKEAMAKAKSVVQRPGVQKEVSPTTLTGHSQPTFITYPEFAPSIAHSSKSWLTLRRLLLLLYLCTGTATTIYAIFLQPLMRKVVDARKEYYQHSTKKVDELILSLSEIQETILAPSTGADESTDPSKAANFPSGVNQAATEMSGVPENLTRVAEIISSESNSEEMTAHNELSFAAEDLIVYLNNHVYMATPFVGYGAGYASFGQGSDDSAKNDMVNRVKTEIRSVKGAVLNMYLPGLQAFLSSEALIFPISRNFPAPSGGLRVA